MVNIPFSAILNKSSSTPNHRLAITANLLGSFLEGRYDKYPIDPGDGYYTAERHGDRKTSLTYWGSINDGNGYWYNDNQPNELVSFANDGWPVSEAEDANNSWFHTAFEPVAYAKWFIKNSGYDKNGDGKIDVGEAITTKNARYKLDVSDIESHYKPYLTNIPAFVSADINDNGLIEKDNGEFSLLLKYYAEHTPGGLTGGTLWGLYQDKKMAKPALDAFKNDTGIEFHITYENGVSIPYGEFDYNLVNNSAFLVKIGGQVKNTWTLEEQFPKERSANNYV